MRDSRWWSQKRKEHDDFGKNMYSGFLGSLIMDPLSDFHNSKWRILDGGLKNEKVR